MHSRGEPQCIPSTSAGGVEFATIEREKGVDLELSQGTGKAGESEKGNLTGGIVNAWIRISDEHESCQYIPNSPGDAHPVVVNQQVTWLHSPK